MNLRMELLFILPPWRNLLVQRRVLRVARVAQSE